LESVLKVDEVKLKSLFDAKKIQKGKEYTELDFYILRSLKLNIYSDTAPYRSKNKQIQRSNVDINRLNIPDLIDDDFDHEGYILSRKDDLMKLIELMGFSEKAISIFVYRFFDCGKVKDWPGTEKPKEIYCLYSRIMKLLKKKINGEILI